jgi:hypothetical protein
MKFSQVGDPHDPKSRTESQKAAFAFFKRSIYHQVLIIALKPLQHPSEYGEAVTCSDSVQRVLTTGIIIQSVDGEEATCTCATRGPSALHPCSRCLVHKDELTKPTKAFPFRTTQTMIDVVQAARTARSKKQAEEILRDNGLHIVDVSDFLNY